MIGPLGMFRFKGEKGQEAGVELSRILGFGQEWPDEPLPEGAVSTVLIGAEHGAMLCVSNETTEELSRRYDEIARVAFRQVMESNQ